MHPGPMNEGVEIAADVAAGPTLGDHGAGDQRRGRPDGAAVPPRRGASGRGTGARRMSGIAAGTGRRVGALADGLVLRGWAVDPATGREGAAEIVDRRRDHHEAHLAVGCRGGRAHPGRRGRRARLHRPTTRTSASPATRTRRRSPPGLAAAAHGGFTTVCAHAQHDARASTSRASSRGSVQPPRRPGRPSGLLVHGAVTVGSRGGAARRPRRAGGRRRRRLLRRRIAGQAAPAPAQRARVRGRARAADRRPPRGRHAHGRRRGERGVRGDGPGPQGWPVAAEASCGRRATSRSSPTSSGTCPAPAST